MSTNVGGAEKAVRILLGIALLLAGFFHVVAGNWAIAAYIVGAIALVTGVFGFCPAWAIFRINTSSTGHANPK
jgi:uncharacterized membrane protein HdeD (DUF308 family)